MYSCKKSCGKRGKRYEERGYGKAGNRFFGYLFLGFRFRRPLLLLFSGHTVLLLASSVYPVRRAEMRVTSLLVKGSLARSEPIDLFCQSAAQQLLLL